MGRSFLSSFSSTLTYFTSKCCNRTREPILSADLVKDSVRKIYVPVAKQSTGDEFVATREWGHSKILERHCRISHFSHMMKATIAMFRPNFCTCWFPRTREYEAKRGWPSSLVEVSSMHAVLGPDSTSKAHSSALRTAFPSLLRTPQPSLLSDGSPVFGRKNWVSASQTECE
jgi:hypothetical protein